jgi:hypothetical protein
MPILPLKNKPKSTSIYPTPPKSPVAISAVLLVLDFVPLEMNVITHIMSTALDTSFLLLN